MEFPANRAQYFPSFGFTGNSSVCNVPLTGGKVEEEDHYKKQFCTALSGTAFVSQVGVRRPAKLQKERTVFP
jgi:hypothetical protein